MKVKHISSSVPVCCFNSFGRSVFYIVFLLVGRVKDKLPYALWLTVKFLDLMFRSYIK